MYKIILGITVILLLSVKGYSQCDTTVNRAVGNAYGPNFPARAFDTGAGSDTSNWATTDGGVVQEIGIDIGQAFNFCTIKMKWGRNGYPSDFAIYGSSFWGAFVPLKTITNNKDSTLTIDSLPTTGTYSILKIYMYGKPDSFANYKLYSCKAYSTIANTLPAVSLVSPATGVSYLQGSSIDITATASDVDGTIKKLEFYKGSTKLGTDSTFPYSYTWANADTGHYAIYAKAFDNLGGTKISDTANITVNMAPAGMRNWSISGNNVTNTNSGYVAIGGIPTNMPSDTTLKFAVKGSIYAKKLTVTSTLWPDYVFGSGYHLPSLTEVETFIQQHKHLPDVPSVKEVENKGVDLGYNQEVLLRKIEELTLYIIDLNKKMEEQSKLIKDLQNQQQRKNP